MTAGPAQQRASRRARRWALGRRGFLGGLLVLGLARVPWLPAPRTRMRGGWILRDDDR